MTTKILINILGTLAIIQFLIGFTGVITTESWDVFIGFAMIISIIWAMFKVNRE